MDTRENIVLQNNKVYELSDTSINVYSFKGKKLGSYKLPEGKRKLYEEGIDKEEYKYMINNSFSVCGDDIYYVNKNGVYKCNTKKGKFQMFYDGAQDDYFGHDYGVEELCVKDKNTFYIRFADAGFHVTCGDSNSIKLIQYSR